MTSPEEEPSESGARGRGGEGRGVGLQAVAALQPVETASIRGRWVPKKSVALLETGVHHGGCRALSSEGLQMVQESPAAAVRRRKRQWRRSR